MSRVFFGSTAVVASDANLITAGQETFPRTLISGSAIGTGGTGQMRLTYFTSRKTETINNIRVQTGGTGAGATPTLCRMGLYSVDGSGNLTLVASHANDTTLFAATSTQYAKALTTPYNIIAGQRYAFAIVIVSSFTMPTFTGIGLSGNQNASLASPTIVATSTQSDLAASIAVGSVLATSGGMIYGEVYP